MPGGRPLDLRLHGRQEVRSLPFPLSLLLSRYVQRDSRTVVMKRKTEAPKEDPKKSKKEEDSSETRR